MIKALKVLFIPSLGEFTAMMLVILAMFALAVLVAFPVVLKWFILGVLIVSLVNLLSR